MWRGTTTKQRKKIGSEFIANVVITVKNSDDSKSHTHKKQASKQQKRNPKFLQLKFAQSEWMLNDLGYVSFCDFGLKWRE